MRAEKTHLSCVLCCLQYLVQDWQVVSAQLIFVTWILRIIVKYLIALIPKNEVNPYILFTNLQYFLWILKKKVFLKILNLQKTHTNNIVKRLSASGLFKSRLSTMIPSLQ